MPDTYRIKNWDSLFENNRTRELKNLEWVPVPNRMDSEGYTALVDHPDAAAHLGAWTAILEIASRQKVRGTLPQGAAGTAQALARMSRLPVLLFEVVLCRLVNELKWIELVTEIPQPDAGKPQIAAPRVRALREGNGMELNGIEGNGNLGDLSSQDDEETINFSDWGEEVYRRHPKKAHKFLAMQKLQSRFSSDEPSRILFDKHHRDQCLIWRDEGKNADFIPPLAKPDDSGYISDEAWVHPPAGVNGHSPPRLSEVERKRAELFANWPEQGRKGA